LPVLTHHRPDKDVGALSRKIEGSAEGTCRPVNYVSGTVWSRESMFARGIVPKRISGTKRDVGVAVLFLASDDSHYVTG
jgi:hypothetical protein